ncbi:hypothetical protein [Paracoccus shanxieyensis]|nr:hypothetical protein [Paracoccus shanxieyensis]
MAASQPSPTLADAAPAARDDLPNLFAELPPDEDAALRALIRMAIRDELQGEMGERLSHNMRSFIRLEVEAVIRDLCAEA